MLRSKIRHWIPNNPRFTPSICALRCLEHSHDSVLSLQMNGKNLRCSTVRGVVLAFILVTAPLINADVVWTGPLITYSQPSSAPTEAANQDRITPDVWLTRASSKGLFNAFSETNATALSPAGTEWAFGAITNYVSLDYTNWLTMLNGRSPTTLVGQQLVVHLIPDDIYAGVQFTFWGSMSNGGFAYERSTPAVNLSGASTNGGQFTFSYTVNPGLDYVIESSSNLVDWAALATNVASGNPATFSDPFNSIGARFYRVDLLLNP
jgi:hypothetical protein